MLSRRALRATAMVGCLLLAGCAEMPRKSPLLYASQYSQLEPGKTDAVLEPTNEPHVEARVNRRQDLDAERVVSKPALCLALSGGGVRSASFSIGVLKALHQSGQLMQVEHISAVSGGGYALAWYLMHYFNGGSDDNLFSDQSTLSAGSASAEDRLVSNTRFYTEGEHLLALSATPLVIPFHLVSNFIFDWQVNVGVPSWRYRSRISTLFLERQLVDTRPTVFELAQMARRRGLPQFSISTTAWPSGSSWKELTLRDHLFTFSSSAYGSGAFGVYRYGDDPASPDAGDRRGIDIGEVVALSGAAWDYNEKYRSELRQTLMSASATNLGGYIPNPAVSPATRRFHKLLPFPLYLIHHFRKDVTGVGIYLTDGGHVENLAVFPLLARGCSRIVIVDAEHDPYYEFEGYWFLKNALRDQFELELRVDPIEHRTAPIHRGAAKSCGRYSVPKTCDGENDDPSDARKYPRWLAIAAQPVMEGHVWQKDVLLSNITYIKLAYKPEIDVTDTQLGESEKQALARAFAPGTYLRSWRDNSCNVSAGRVVEDYYYCVKEERHTKPRFLYLGVKSQPFPQQPTSDQNFSKQQMQAYIELGRQRGASLKLQRGN